MRQPQQPRLGRCIGLGVGLRLQKRKHRESAYMQPVAASAEMHSHIGRSRAVQGGRSGQHWWLPRRVPAPPPLASLDPAAPLPALPGGRGCLRCGGWRRPPAACAAAPPETSGRRLRGGKGGAESSTSGTTTSRHRRLAGDAGSGSRSCVSRQVRWLDLRHDAGLAATRHLAAGPATPPTHPPVRFVSIIERQCAAAASACWGM